MIFGRFLEKFLGLERQNSWKYGISKKSGPIVTGMTGTLRPSRREVKNDVSYYLQSIVMGLYTVCEEMLDSQDRALRRGWRFGESKSATKQHAIYVYICLPGLHAAYPPVPRQLASAAAPSRCPCRESAPFVVAHLKYTTAFQL